MTKKEIHYPYYCRKCTRTVYFGENDIINDVCKICGRKMEKGEPFFSHPKDTIKNVNRKGSCVTMNFQQTNPIVTCPYCSSTNTKKISGISKAGSVAMFGIFSQKVKKQWHCNRCGSDF